jgi:energy-coupling factor transporter ATP-binding protein EcfA2
MHYLITGGSGCGKTTLAANLSQTYKSSGYGVIVFDPMADDRWIADFKTDSFQDFLAVYSGSRNCRVFIDECKLLESPENKKLFAQMAAIGRHYGHVHYYIGQRAKSVPPAVRHLCYGVFAFRQSHDDARELANDFAQEGLRECATLQKGEYFFSDKYTIYKGNAFT